MKTVWNTVSAQLNAWEVATVHWLPRLAAAIVVMAIAYGLAAVARSYLRRLGHTSQARPGSLRHLLPWVGFTLLMLAGSFLALEIVGLESVLSKLLAGAGVVGIVVGFAFKEIASNALSGVLVHAQEPFRPGEWVAFGDTYGVVEQISWITTSLRTVTGQIVFVPNQLIYSEPFTNYSRTGKRRIVIQTGVSYGDDLEHVKRVAMDEIKLIEGRSQDDPVDFFFTSIGGFSYNFEVRFWIQFKHQTDFLAAQSEAIIRVKKRFEKENISIAYPVQTLDFAVKGGVNLFDQPLSVRLEEARSTVPRS